MSLLLAHKGYDVLFLHYFGLVRHARRVRRKVMPYFARYVFAGVDDALTIHGINRVMGVSSVVCLGDDPLEIPLPVIEELRARGDEKGKVHFLPKDRPGQRAERWRAGQTVCVIDGPLAGLLAVVALDIRTPSQGNEVRVWLDGFGGKVDALLDPVGLKIVSPERGL